MELKDQRELLSRIQAYVLESLQHMNVPDAGAAPLERDGDSLVARIELCAPEAERLKTDRFSPFPIRTSSPPHDYGTLEIKVAPNPWQADGAALVHWRHTDPALREPVMISNFAYKPWEESLGSMVRLLLEEASRRVQPN